MKVSQKRLHEIWKKESFSSVQYYNVYWDYDSWNCLIYTINESFLGCYSLEEMINEGWKKV